jgi:hypothetical protein
MHIEPKWPREDDFTKKCADAKESLIDEEMNTYFAAETLENDSAQNDKLSQLRQLLEKNLKPSSVQPPTSGPPGGGSVSTSAFRPTTILQHKTNNASEDKVDSATTTMGDNRESCLVIDDIANSHNSFLQHRST